MGAGVIGPDSGTFLAMSTKLPFLRNRPIVPASVTVIKIHGNHMKIRPRRVFVLQRKTQGLVKSHNDELEEWKRKTPTRRLPVSSRPSRCRCSGGRVGALQLTQLLVNHWEHQHSFSPIRLC